MHDNNKNKSDTGTGIFWPMTYRKYLISKSYAEVVNLLAFFSSKTMWRIYFTLFFYCCYIFICVKFRIMCIFSYIFCFLFSFSVSFIFCSISSIYLFHLFHSFLYFYYFLLYFLYLNFFHFYYIPSSIFIIF